MLYIAVKIMELRIIFGNYMEIPTTAMHLEYLITVITVIVNNNDQ
jgi:hypothetical protein